MKDIKTRPKSREVQVRDAAVLAPRELAKVLRDTGRAKLERQGRTGRELPRPTFITAPRGIYWAEREKRICWRSDWTHRFPE